MYPIISFPFHQEEDLLLARQIRYMVFVEEQGVAPELEFDEHEKEAIHYLLFHNDKPIAAARRRQTGGGIKLERFAVIPEYRNKGIGAELLSRVMEDVRDLKVPIYLHAQDRAVRFYQRHGFTLVGDAFEEAGIVHYKMTFSGK